MKAKGMFFWALLTVVLFVAFWFLMKSQFVLKSENEKLTARDPQARISWETARDTVAANRKNLCDAFNQGEFEKIGPLYMENAVIRGADGKLYSGPDEIVNYWKGLRKQGVVSIEYRLLALFPLGRIDYRVGNVRYDHAAQEYGRYTFNREKEGESSVTEMSGKNVIDYHQEDCPWTFGSEEHP